MQANREFDIVVYGATGFTGALVADYLLDRYGCFATGLMRASIELPLDSPLPLQKGDRLQLIGEESNLKQLASMGEENVHPRAYGDETGVEILVHRHDPKIPAIVVQPSGQVEGCDA